MLRKSVILCYSDTTKVYAHTPDRIYVKEEFL